MVEAFRRRLETTNPGKLLVRPSGFWIFRHVRAMRRWGF